MSGERGCLRAVRRGKMGKMNSESLREEKRIGETERWRDEKDVKP